jgi:6-phosphofructokinase 1
MLEGRILKNFLIAQSGGPSSAINATLAGIMAKAVTGADKVFGAVNGIQGVIEDRIVDITYAAKDPAALKILAQTPAAALYSCRYKIGGDEKKFERMVEVLKKRDIHYFVNVGGNDSMDTVDQLSAYAAVKGIKNIFVVGAPKTIDNDLAETDHCPGYASAAKYIATTFAELERELAVYDRKSATVVEIMGRNAGWLAASAALASVNGGPGPDLIYLPERDFSNDQFLADVEKKLNEKPRVIIAVSEGIHTADGKLIGGSDVSVDAFGHIALSGAAHILSGNIKTQLGCRARSIELSYIQRCAGHIASATDINEARILGENAAKCALEESSGVMTAIYRLSNNPYAVEYKCVPVSKVANKEKKVPDDFINADANDVTEKVFEYILPLIQGEVDIEYQNGIPKHLRLA